MALAPTSRLLKAVVIGGTGATGKCLLGELITSPAFEEVISIGRREAIVPERYDVSATKEKLKHRIVDLDLEKFTIESAKSFFDGKDVVFCCLGSTRGAARRQPGNTAENFRRIDLHLVVRSAEIAKAAGVPHFSLVSSVGGNSNSWFLYLRTKGDAENGVEALGFERATLWKPGLLQRGEERRSVEKFFGFFMSSLPVWELAVAMRFEAEQFAYKREEFPKCSRYETRDIRRIISEAQKQKADALKSEKKDEEKLEAAAEAAPEKDAKPETATEVAPAPESSAEPKTVTEAAPAPESSAEPKTATEAAPGPESSAEPKTATEAAPAPESSAEPEEGGMKEGEKENENEAKTEN